jgi:hypothetical protein
MKRGEAMIESEMLVQRFLDHELSAEERVRFLVRLGRDGALRERLIDLEQLLLDVGRLARPALPAGFVARVMQRIEPPPSPWRRLLAAFRMPRYRFEWNLASALAAACLAFVLGGLLAANFRAPATESRDAAISNDAATPPSMVLVRLVVVRPGARTVQAAGDFNGWNPSRTPLEEISNGAWAVTIPLEPGRYEYMYVVDGQQWIADPFAVEQNDDGFGSRNAVLEVSPPAGAPL